jgi:lipopolysaccharide transport system ATP-binding protein
MSEDNQPIISVNNISKKYCRELNRSLRYAVKDIVRELIPKTHFFSHDKSVLREGEFWAVKDVSFELKRGESLAIIGENGAGKSTLLKVLYGLIKPDTGEIRIRGRVGAIIELGEGFDPVLTGRENIFITASLLGFPKKQIQQLFDEVVAFSELEEFIDTPIQFYSSGMKARLAFSVASHLNPNLLFVDEVLAVGDLDFQRKCVNQMLKYLASGGSIILVSHIPNHIQSVCQRGILLENGAISFAGNSIETLDRYFKNQLSKISSYKTTSNDGNLRETKPLIIEEVILEPTQGEFIQTNEDCQLRVKYTASQSFEDVIWGLSIWTHDNLVNISGNYDLTPRTIEAGEGELNCLIPELPLSPGTYLLRVAICQLASLQSLALSGWEDAPLEFKVEIEPNLLNNLLYSTNQMMMLHVRWH